MLPRVALESTVIAHGLPHPHNEDTALTLERIVGTEGAAPRTIGIIRGEAIIGLNGDQIHHLATASDVRKLSLRDLPTAVAQGLDGATTVAATMHLAYHHGIGVMATGGIGGVHRAPKGTRSYDVSADLEALRRLPMTVVCSGAKAILDLKATREMLETHGVIVVGYQTDEMPAFYSASSGLPVDVRCDTPKAVADLVRARDRLSLPGTVLVTVPPPEDAAISAGDIAPAIEEAVADAEREGLRSAEVTPFVLDRVRALFGDAALDANQALLAENARVAAHIASALGEVLSA